ncbi:uncharacterized protein LOC125227541 [Leguminivora glycinivorella]|uniref:uncharacterized protein LOC125227541 n=1 Tax=Leguminivora glycinivorella TaxID=1035111 RepID=UPI00200D7488|nr:uncharacterized protein LOC125227541 [Leguminivora glycinivorella]
MSPLARSLLVLGALLAAADAMSNPFCDSLSRGEETGDYESFVLTGTGDAVTVIPDKCSRPGRKLVGDYLSACNPYHTPKLSTPMGIRNSLGAVYITCARTDPGCSSLQVQVLQYCKMVTAPKPLLLG